MSFILADLSTYNSFNTTATYDVYLVDGTSYLGVTISQIFQDGVLLNTGVAPAITPRRYIPQNVITAIQVTEDNSYLDSDD